MEQAGISRNSEIIVLMFLLCLSFPRVRAGKRGGDGGPESNVRKDVCSATISPCACLSCWIEANGVVARKCAMPRSSLRYFTCDLKFKNSISVNEREILN